MNRSQNLINGVASMIEMPVPVKKFAVKTG